MSGGNERFAYAPVPDADGEITPPAAVEQWRQAVRDRGMEPVPDTAILVITDDETYVEGEVTRADP